MQGRRSDPTSELVDRSCAALRLWAPARRQCSRPTHDPTEQAGPLVTTILRAAPPVLPRLLTRGANAYRVPWIPGPLPRRSHMPSRRQALGLIGCATQRIRPTHSRATAAGQYVCSEMKPLLVVCAASLLVGSCLSSPDCGTPILDDVISNQWKEDTLGCLRFRLFIIDSLLRTDDLQGLDFECVQRALGPGRVRSRGDMTYHDYLITCEDPMSARFLMIVVDGENVVHETIQGIP